MEKNSYQTPTSFLLCLFLLLVGIPALAQTGSITGTVHDRTTGRPIPYVSVSLYPVGDSVAADGLLSDEGGYFRFDNVKSGQYLVRLTFLGYEAISLPKVTIAGNQPTDLGIIHLVSAQQFLDEVAVSGQQSQIVSEIDKQVFRADQFEASKGGTAVDVLRNMPSVAVDGQGQISIRGAQGFLLLINGKPVVVDASTMLSQLPANQVENVELITSPSAKYDPDGRGGIINITTKKGATDGFALIANIQGGLPPTNDFDNAAPQHRHGADLTVNSRTDRWEISASGNYLRNDNAGLRDGEVYTLIGNRKTVFPSHGERSFDKYNYGGRLSAGFTPNERNSFSVGFFAGHRFQDRVADIYYNNVTTDVTTGAVIGRSTYFNPNLQTKQGDFLLGNLDYKHTFAEGSSLAFTALYERASLYGSTLNRNIDANETRQHTLSTYQNPLDGFRGKVDFSTPLGGGTWESGYQYRWDKQDGQFVYRVGEMGNTNLVVVPDFSGTVAAVNRTHAFYTQYAGKADRLEYSGGLRYEYASRNLQVSSVENNDYRLALSNLFPSASAQYRVSKRWSTKAGISRRVHRTNNFELNPIPEREHSETLEQGDANLLPEFIYLVELGVVGDFENSSVFGTVYYQDIENPIQRVNSVYADTILNRVYTNANRARRAGIELALTYRPAKWTQLYLGTNLYQSHINGTVLDDIDSRKNEAWVYSISGNANVQLTSQLSVHGNVNYLSSRPTVQGQDSRFLSPNLSVKHTFMDGALTAHIQWQNIGMGVFDSNQQRITTWGSDFYTTTNYIYEVDIIMLSLSFNLNRLARQIKLPTSEFGEKEF